MELPPQRRHRGLSLAQLTQGFHGTGLPSQEGKSLCLPIPRNSTIPDARGKRPRGLPTSRGDFVGLQTPQPGSAPVLGPIPKSTWNSSPIPSSLPCPRILWQSTARIPCLAHPRPGARDGDEPQERRKSPNPARRAQNTQHPQGEGWGSTSRDVQAQGDP